MKRILSIAAASFALALAASPALADMTYVTGTDANHDGVDDAFTVNGGKAYLVTQTANGWPSLPNPGITTGQYISFAADQSNATQGSILGQPYVYAFSFDWAGAANSTTMDFRWISDDYLTDVLLNGVSLGVNNVGKPQPWTLSNSVAGVSANVLSGANTINFLVANTGGQAPGYTGPSGPTGFAADFTVHGDATPIGTVPEPGSVALIGLAAMVLAGIRRRRTEG